MVYFSIKKGVTILSTKRKATIAVLVVILIRLYNIYTPLQTSILSYRSIEIQPNIANEISSDVSKTKAETSKKSENNISDETLSTPVEVTEISSDINADTLYDPVLKVNITIEAFNLYDLDELRHFKGIGEKTAQAIVDYRTQNGAFTDFKTLLSVKGIGEKKLQQMINGK